MVTPTGSGSANIAGSCDCQVGKSLHTEVRLTKSRLLQLYQNHIKTLITQVLWQVAPGGCEHRLASVKVVFFRFAIRECKSAAHVILDNDNTVRMGMHDRFLVCAIVDPEHTYALVFKLNLVML